MSVYDDIKAERAHQDEKWGGAAHDDTHAAENWIEYIDDKLTKANLLIGNPDDIDEPDAQFRRRLIQIAALAIAAVEYVDRHHHRHHQEGSCMS